MAGSWHDGVWERGPKHGWRAIHRVRRNKKGKIVEEEYVERSFLLTLIMLPVLATTLWWTQARLDGWPQLLSVVGAVIASIYAVYLILAVWLVDAAGRLIRRLID